ncbi:MAG TPA: sugar transferase [Thermomicrobiales bacterium]|nr:sugar transferase [Thermomicrobiales bacterium]
MDSVTVDLSKGRLPQLTGSFEQDFAAVLSRRRLQRGLNVATLLLTDTLSILLGLAIAYVIRFQTRWGLFYEHDVSPVHRYVLLALAALPLFLFVLACYQLYSERRIFDGAKEYPRIISAVTMAVMIVILFSFMFESGLVIARGWIVLSWISLIVTVAVGRFLARRLIYRLHSAGRLGQRVLVIGSGDDLLGLADRVRQVPAAGLQIADVVDCSYLAGSSDDASPSMAALIAATRADALLISAASVPQPILSRIVREVSRLPTALHLVPGMYEILTTGVQAGEIHGLPVVTMNKVRITGLDLILKRMLDYIVALGVLLLTSPMLLLAALLVRTTSRGPVLYGRPVVGQQGRIFVAWKFRTMRVDGDEILRSRPDLREELERHGKLVDDPRVTPVGSFLRRWSIDELPQLLNVLAGQMSLVGPRMITEPELNHFGRWRENFSTVKPGLTGLWQISGRSDLGYEDRVRLDMHYIRNYSIWIDIEILLRTVPAVLDGRGAY